MSIVGAGGKKMPSGSMKPQNGRGIDPNGGEVIASGLPPPVSSHRMRHPENTLIREETSIIRYGNSKVTHTNAVP